MPAKPARTPPRRVRQRDIAAAAGVVQSTVSRALAGTGADRMIDERTRAHVLEIARQMGYKLDPHAQRLKGKNTRVIGVHTSGDEIPLTADNYNHEYVLGMREAAEELGYDLLLFIATTHPDEDSATAFPQGQNRLAIADGSVIIGRRDDHEELRRLAEEGYPCVRIDRRDVPGHDIAWVDADLARGVVEMATALVAAGYDRLLYVGARTALEPFVERQRGFTQSLAEPGLIPRGGQLLRTDIIDREFVRRLQAGADPGTAIVADGHRQAREIAVQAQQIGFAPPIAVLQNQWATADPRLHCAYLTLPQRAMGNAAARLLVEIIEGGPAERRQIVLPCQPTVVTPAPSG